MVDVEALWPAAGNSQRGSCGEYGSRFYEISSLHMESSTG